MGSRGLIIDPGAEYVQTPFLQGLIQRSLLYLRAGIPVHLQGPSGTGKTASALYLARQLGRPVAVIYGSDDLSPTDLVGRHFGIRRKSVIDEYIHSVERREEEIESDWVDGRLLAACREGWTLVYDEFSRSRPEANNALLSVLEERILDLPATHRGEKYVRVHPEFRAIFTSNPDEYAGVHSRPDALLDRMITIDLGGLDEESELAVVVAKTGLAESDAATVVSTVRRFRRQHASCLKHSIRASLLIGTVLKSTGRGAEPGEPFFEQLCQDVLGAGHRHREASGSGDVAGTGKSRNASEEVARVSERDTARTPAQVTAGSAGAESARPGATDPTRTGSGAAQRGPAPQSSTLRKTEGAKKGE